MKEILLINPVTSGEIYGGKLSIPMGLLYVGSYLRQHGYGVNIIDLNNVPDREAFYRSLEDKRGHLLCIGLSVMTVQVPSALEVSLRIRALDPSIPIIWGGIHPTIFLRETASDPAVDFVVKGEGEATALELVRALEAGKGLGQIHGLAFRSDGQVVVNPDREVMDINRLPDLQWDLLEDVRAKGLAQVAVKTTFYRMLPLQTTRGCPYRCAFCINVALRNNYRCRDMEAVFQDIKKMLASGVDRIYLIDDEPFADIGRLKAFVEGIEKGGLAFTWFMDVRASDFRGGRITPDLLERVRRSGCEIVSIGAESGSERILRKLRKEITPDDTLNAARMLSHAGMTCNFSFMVGLPGETGDDMQKTFRLIEAIKKIDSRHNILGPQVFRPYPGSLLYAECQELGLQPPTTLREWANSGYISDYIVDRITRQNYHRYPWLGVSRGVMTGFFEQLDNFHFYLRAHNLGTRSTTVNWLMRKAAVARCRRSYYKYPVERGLYKLVNKTRLSKHFGWG